MRVYGDPVLGMHVVAYLWAVLLTLLSTEGKEVDEDVSDKTIVGLAVLAVVIGAVALRVCHRDTSVFGFLWVTGGYWFLIQGVASAVLFSWPRRHRPSSTGEAGR